ncbi:MAG: 50S ribosomal protein L23 [Saprospiraceae bacterium]|nr:50S ribosomal protein L23 [Saprospiraceae bacterium]MCC7505506.1 50S ribosomal protein L23 [Saprospiraceae bacterium]
MAKQILIKPVITEKSTKLADKRSTYVFVVNKNANKIEVKNAVEKFYNVSVDSVNTAVMPAKPKARSTKTTIVRGRKASYKKAYVTLTPGERIDIFGATEE